MISYLTIGTIIFTIGLFGALKHKDMLRIFISVEIMIAAANLVLAVFLIYPPSGNSFDNYPANMAASGFTFLFFVWIAAIANAVVGLPLFLLIRRRAGTQNTEKLNQLNG